jgi:hypothetical protein
LPAKFFPVCGGIRLAAGLAGDRHEPHVGDAER